MAHLQECALQQKQVGFHYHIYFKHLAGLQSGSSEMCRVKQKQQITGWNNLHIPTKVVYLNEVHAQKPLLYNH